MDLSGIPRGFLGRQVKVEKSTSGGVTYHHHVDNDLLVDTVMPIQNDRDGPHLDYPSSQVWGFPWGHKTAFTQPKWLSRIYVA